MISIAAFSEIVSLIYAAVVSPELWDEAIAHIHRAFATPTVAVGQVLSTGLAFADGSSRSVVGVFPPGVGRSYSEHYCRLDYVLDAVDRGPVGVLRTGTEVIAPHNRTEFYADFLRANELGDGLLVRLTNDVRPTSLMVAGSLGSEAFDTEDRTTLLTLLVPHLQQALRAQNGLSNLSSRAADLTQALDSVDHAIVVARSEGRIVHANAAAERLLREGDGLATQAGRLVVSAPHLRAGVEALLRGALSGDALGVRQGGSLACARPSGKRPYAVHVLPLNHHGAEFTPRGPTAMLVIVDPERRPMPAAERLRQLFGLTKTEAAVAQLVVNGHGLGPIGEQLVLSRDTVKTHLRSVFNKTGTHRQAELVRLLLAITV
jgi:DNA-binding CsgD family transcriptional regulator/PAS domain-containing protein